MALTIAKLTLASGVELTNPLIVISDLNISNNVSQSQRLEISQAPAPAEAEGYSQAVNQEYSINTTQSGGKHANYMVSVFLSQVAFEAGKPPVEKLHNNHQLKIFQLNLNDAQYSELDARVAAYKHLSNQEEFTDAEEVEGVTV